eukprot:COSAG06_NODE_9007_length_2013_cov_2.133751_1_plen_179_part_10
MNFRCIVGTAVAALLLCGVGLGAPTAGGEKPRNAGVGSTSDAAGLEEELRVGASELAAVPAESRAVLAKVLGRLEGMRGELEGLKAGKLELEARVAELEESECERCEENGCEEEKEDMEAEKAEKTDKSYSHYINGTARHLKQAGAPACGPASWAARTAVVMDACCPATPGGHRRAQDT